MHFDMIQIAKTGSPALCGQVKHEAIIKDANHGPDATNDRSFLLISDSAFEYRSTFVRQE
jgi:hypothetical protein